MTQGYDVKATLTICMQTEDTILFERTLENTQLHYNLLMDPLGFNVFHDIASCIVREELLLNFLTILIAQVKKRYAGQASSILLEMINTQSLKESRTPLIIAIQNNKFKIVKEYVKIGADFRIKDRMRQGPLHIAAASGRVGIFVYFYSMGISAAEEDANLRTPLHLSALEGEEIMSNIILAWNKEIINKQDENGQTALHLATFAKSYRIVRHLLINGAHRKTRDKEGKTPLDYAKEQENNELIKILKHSNFIFKANPCKPPIKPIKKGRKLMILYIFLFLARYSAVILFLLPRMNGLFLFISLSLFASSGISFILAGCKNPGYVEINTNVLEMYEKYKPDYICPYCKCKKIKTTRHCQHCKRCVKKFDHHCPWIHNCVGENNKKVFIFFLLIFTIDLIFHATLGALDYFNLFKQPHILLPDIPTNHDESALAITIFCVLNLIIVFPIVYVQIGNILKGTTTFERFGFGISGKDSKISDTQSMLLGNENDWENLKTIDYSATQGCCIKKNNKLKKNERNINLSSQTT